MRLAITILALATLAAPAQQIGQNAPAGKAAATFTTGTQLVVEAVVVTDKTGSPVEGLTAKDFTVTENGAPQTIRFFEHQKLPEAGSQAPLAQSEPEQIHIYDKLG